MSPRSVSILIAAMGGQGGGVLADWIAGAVRQAGFLVQSTSIPGVAQRTGATTYYIEFLPVPVAALQGRRPVLGLYPSHGNVDVVIAAELAEAGRMLAAGFVTPGRTTLIASAQRLFATSEKVGMGDGRADLRRLLRAATELPGRSVLVDPGDRRLEGLALNALLLGALAGSGAVPLEAEPFRAAIVDGGKAVQPNLAGFDAGLQEAAAPPDVEAILVRQTAKRPDVPRSAGSALNDRIARLPVEALAFAEQGVSRLVDYQGEAYARLYLERLESVARLDLALGRPVARETARWLALWMSYEDIIRVAQLKSRADRFARLREEVRATPDQIVEITEFLKPGLEEVSSVLPPRLGRGLRRWAERRDLLHRWHLPMRVTSSGAWGYSRLWLLARLRPWRPRTLRWAEEQAAIEAWLEALRAALTAGAAGFAPELALLPRLLKGYSDPQQRGRSNFAAIFAAVVEPARRSGDYAAAAARLVAARTAALQDPEGDALRAALPPQAAA